MQHFHRAMRSASFSTTLCAAFAAVTAPAFAQTITVQSGKPDGVYKLGETVVWHIGVTGEGASDITKIAFVVKKGQIEQIGKGELTLHNGTADLEAPADSPGSLLALLTAMVPGKPPIKDLAGALVAPEDIKPSEPRPADFDAFWKSKIDELQKIPINPVLEQGDSGKPNLDYYKITMDNIRGSHIQGQIARPKTGTKFPAILHFQGAGVYPLQKPWVTNDAANGWLSLDINAHDLPIDQTKEFYDDALKNKFNGDYARIGNTDREKDYFLRMYLSCYRAIEYLKSRDDWDGKTIVVNGGSQGGLQTLMVGGLYPGKLTALIAEVPAGCDLTGAEVDRQPGWPVRYWSDTERKSPKVEETIRYYDVVNFASRIHCPVLVGTGLIDQTCPAAGVCAAFNQIKTPKELVVLERAEHIGKRENGVNTHLKYYQRSGAWFSALVKGDAPPVNPVVAAGKQVSWKKP